MPPVIATLQTLPRAPAFVGDAEQMQEQPTRVLAIELRSAAELRGDLLVKPLPQEHYGGARRAHRLVLGAGLASRRAPCASDTTQGSATTQALDIKRQARIMNFQISRRVTRKVRLDFR
jgi:hypothetical protein